MRPNGTASPTRRFFSPIGAVLVFGEQRVDLVPMVAVDDAGRDAVDVDAVLDQREAGRLGEADDGRLGGAIDARPAARRAVRPGRPC